MAAPSKLSTLKAAKLLGVKVGEGDKAVLKAAYKKAALRVSPRQSSLVPRRRRKGRPFFSIIHRCR